MIVELVGLMIVSERLNTHSSADDSDDDQTDSDISLSLYFRNNVDPENGSKYLNQTNKHLVEVDIEPEFIKTEQSTIVNELN